MTYCTCANLEVCTRRTLFSVEDSYSILNFNVIWQKSCFRLLPNINKLHTDDMLDRKGWIVNAGFSFCRVRVESISQNSPYPLLAKSSWIIIKIQLKLRGRPSALHDPWMTWRRKNESGMIAKAGNERFVGSFGGGGMAASF